MERLMTIEEIAGYLQVPTSWVYARTSPKCQAQIPHAKIGRHLRFDLEAVKAWAKNGCKSSGCQPEGEK